MYLNIEHYRLCISIRNNRYTNLLCRSYTRDTVSWSRNKRKTYRTIFHGFVFAHGLMSFKLPIPCIVLSVYLTMRYWGKLTTGQGRRFGQTGTLAHIIRAQTERKFCALLRIFAICCALKHFFALMTFYGGFHRAEQSANCAQFARCCDLLCSVAIFCAHFALILRYVALILHSCHVFR